MKIKKAHMIIIILILSSQGLAIKSLGLHEEGFIIVGENYVAKAPAVLSKPVIINNAYEINVVPVVSISGKAYTFSPTIKEEMLSGLKNRYLFEFENLKEDINIKENIEFNDEYVKTRIEVINLGKRKKTISISYPIRLINSGSILFPSALSKKKENYLVFSKGLAGPCLGVKASYPLPVSGIPVTSSESYSLMITVNLEPGKKFYYDVYFYPFYSTTQKKDYPTELYPLTFNKIITTSGRVRQVTNSGDKLKTLLNALRDAKKSTDPEFALIKKVNLESEKDSLGMTAYAKELCKKLELPCKVIIGKKDSKMYSWIRAYYNYWQDIDPYAGIKSSPGYKIIFEEPTGKTITLKGNTTEDFYESTKWVKEIGESHYFLYLILVLSTAAIVLFIVQLKAKTLTKEITKGEKLIKEEVISGKYNILKEEVKDPFINEVLQKIKEEKGEVDLEKLSSEMKYSKELISFAIDYLVDTGVLKKEEQEQKIERKKLDKNIKKKIIGLAVTIIIIIIILLGLS